MHHQQELQLNNPKINSDKQLLENWAVWLIGSISENIIIISSAYFWQNFVSVHRKSSTLAGYSWPWQLERSRARNRTWKKLRVIRVMRDPRHHRVPALSPKVRQQLSSWCQHHMMGPSLVSAGAPGPGHPPTLRTLADLDTKWELRENTTKWLYMDETKGSNIRMDNTSLQVRFITGLSSTSSHLFNPLLALYKFI